MIKETNDLHKLKLGRLGVLLAVAYLILVIAFYFIAGDQLHYRASRGNLPLPTAEAATTELVEGITVEQLFSVNI